MRNLRHSSVKIIFIYEIINYKVGDIIAYLKSRFKNESHKITFLFLFTRNEI